MIDGEIHWRCSRCRTWKAETQFYRNAAKPSGRQNTCIDCDKQYGRRNRPPQMVEWVHKDQHQLECHLCTFVEAIKRQQQTEQTREDIVTLETAIDVMRRNSHETSPPRHWGKTLLPRLLANATTPLSIDEILEHCSRRGYMINRRRLYVRLNASKRKGELCSPVKGFWTTAERANENFPQDPQSDWVAKKIARRRERQDGTEEFYCRRCDTYRERDDFWKNVRSPDGLQAYCKGCLSTSKWKPASLVERADT